MLFSGKQCSNFSNMKSEKLMDGKNVFFLLQYLLYVLMHESGPVILSYGERSVLTNPHRFLWKPSSFWCVLFEISFPKSEEFPKILQLWRFALENSWEFLKKRLLWLNPKNSMKLAPIFRNILENRNSRLNFEKCQRISKTWSLLYELFEKLN